MRSYTVLLLKLAIVVLVIVVTEAHVETEGSRNAWSLVRASGKLLNNFRTPKTFQEARANSGIIISLQKRVDKDGSLFT